MVWIDLLQHLRPLSAIVQAFRRHRRARAIPVESEPRRTLAHDCRDVSGGFERPGIDAEARGGDFDSVAIADRDEMGADVWKHHFVLARFVALVAGATLCP